MNYRILVVLGLLVASCQQAPKKATVTTQSIVDKAIENSGGEAYKNSKVQFTFRGIQYEAENKNNSRVLKRITKTDSLTITDIKSGNDFMRYFDDRAIVLADSMAARYANSVNSVHYFSRLPYGLNDAAVKKELVGEVQIKTNDYYKVKVTFEENNGGDDFEDVFLYWFNKETHHPDFLAYEYHTDGGGIRFREAFNERRIGGIRFADYRNYKPKKGTTIDFMMIEALFESDSLELLSTIELQDIRVATQD